MEQYKVYTQNYHQQIQRSIDKFMEETGDEEKKWQVGEFDTLTCFIYTPARKEKKSAGEYIAGIVSDIVQHEVIKGFAKSYLKGRKDLGKKDKEQIEKLFIQSNYLKQEEGVSYISYYLVYVPLLKMLEERHSINIDGWIHFRTNQYQTILKDLIEQVIYDYDLQKEYLEFLNLLKETRQLNQSSEDLLHLVITPSKQMYILDKDMNEVTSAYIKKYSSKDLLEKGVTREDLIMNVFILSSPEKVIVHNRTGKTLGFIDTLEILFTNDMSYCDGCDYCRESSRYQQIDMLE